MRVGKGFLSWWNIIFTLLFVGMAICYGYIETIDKPADGVHAWRQTDGLSMAKIFYEKNNSIFEPEMQNRLNDGGKAAGEFPLMYYIVSLLYRIFGVHNWVFRGLWGLILFLGCFNLYKLCSKVLNDPIWGILISLFTFTSPILIIYGISFLPDPVALAFVFIAWRLLYDYREKPSKLILIGATALIVLAATLKITSFISILAIAIVFFLEDLVKRISCQISTKKLLLGLLPLVASSILIFAWYFYASWYSKVHETGYFYLKFAPIWELSMEDFQNIFQSIKGWKKEYFEPSGLHVIYAMAVLVLIPVFIKKLGRIYYWIYVFCVMGFIAFVALFYSQFKDHDYYVVNLLFIIPLTALFFVKKYSFLINRTIVSKRIVQGLFSFLLVLAVIHGSRKAKERFNYNIHWLDLDLYEFRSHLGEYGISKDDLILVPHDPTPNLTLYAIDMKGWSALNFINDPKVFQKKIEAGAKWLVVSDSKFYDNTIIDPYREKLVVDFKGIRVYDIRPDKE